MADQGGVTEDSRRNGPHCGDLPTVVGAIWRTNVRTPAQHYRHPDPCMCDCSLRAGPLDVPFGSALVIESLVMCNTLYDTAYK